MEYYINISLVYKLAEDKNRCVLVTVKSSSLVAHRSSPTCSNTREEFQLVAICSFTTGWRQILHTAPLSVKLKRKSSKVSAVISAYRSTVRICRNVTLLEKWVQILSLHTIFLQNETTSYATFLYFLFSGWDKSKNETRVRWMFFFKAGWLFLLLLY